MNEIDSSTRLFPPKITDDTITRLYTLRMAAAYLNVSQEYARKLCRDGTIACTKVRNNYYLTAEQINLANQGTFYPAR
jgi:excisionase family DNA binding protein